MSSQNKRKRTTGGKAAAKPAAKPVGAKPVGAKPAAAKGSSKELAIWIVAVLAVAAIAFLVTRPASAVMKDVDNVQAQQLIAKGVRVIDVRTAEEYRTGHLDGAENVPVDSISSAASGWNRDKPIFVYCATGARSAIAANWLATNGFRKVYNLKEGIAAWNGNTTTNTASGPNQVPTNGKPVFVEFSSST